MKKHISRPTVALESLGCKLNQAEIQQMAAQFTAAGYQIVSPEEKADIYILNTCTVTHVADRKSRHLLNMARRRNPSARLVAIGCYAEREPATLSGIEGVELVLGNQQKWNLLELLETGLSLSSPAPSFFTSGERTRAFLKVQEGCRNFCAYCIVPLVRNCESSVPVAEVLEQIKKREAAGFKEVVLTGTEIGAYNNDGATLITLLTAILAETVIARVRLSSLQPCHIIPELIALWTNPRLCRHFHLSLQSGSDAVLKRMKRRYLTADYRNKVDFIREKLPDAAVTTDVIVGFPGETETEFKETYNFCRQMKFSRIHAFPYSPRPGTAAMEMPEQVPEPVKKARMKSMLALAKESAQTFHKLSAGETLEVLWEQQTGSIWSGLTGNYIKVYSKSSDNLTNRIIPAKLTRIYRDGMLGDIPRTITNSRLP